MSCILFCDRWVNYEVEDDAVHADGVLDEIDQEAGIVVIIMLYLTCCEARADASMIARSEQDVGGIFFFTRVDTKMQRKHVETRPPTPESITSFHEST